jgi:hypothetical protein
MSLDRREVKECKDSDCDLICRYGGHRSNFQIACPPCVCNEVPVDSTSRPPRTRPAIEDEGDSLVPIPNPFKKTQQTTRPNLHQMTRFSPLQPSPTPSTAEQFDEQRPTVISPQAFQNPLQYQQNAMLQYQQNMLQQYQQNLVRQNPYQSSYGSGQISYMFG